MLIRPPDERFEPLTRSGPGSPTGPGQAAAGRPPKDLRLRHTDGVSSLETDAEAAGDSERVQAVRRAPLIEAPLVCAVDTHGSSAPNGEAVTCPQLHRRPTAVERLADAVRRNGAATVVRRPKCGEQERRRPSVTEEVIVDPRTGPTKSRLPRLEMAISRFEASASTC